MGTRQHGTHNDLHSELGARPGEHPGRSKAPLGSTFGDKVTDPAWKHKPSWYQVSTEDRMIHPDNQRRMASRMYPRTTIELDASHASLASRASEVVDLIDDAVVALG